MRIPAGSDRGECLIEIADDEEPDIGEQFTVALGVSPASPSNAILRSPIFSTVTIQDDGGQSALHHCLLWDKLTMSLESSHE